MSDRVVTSATHTDIATSPPAHHHHITPAHRAITLQGMEALERGGVQPPSLAPVATAKRICMIKPIFSLTYKFGHPRHIITTSPHYHHPGTSSYHPARCGSLHDAGETGCREPPHVTKYRGQGITPRKGKEAATSHRGRPVCNRGAAALTLVPVATHTDIATSPPAHHHTKLPPCKGMKRDAGGHTDE